jgi:hypothetical protein
MHLRGVFFKKIMIVLIINNISQKIHQQINARIQLIKQNRDAQ